MELDAEPELELEPEVLAAEAVTNPVPVVAVFVDLELPVEVPVAVPVEESAEDDEELMTESHALLVFVQCDRGQSDRTHQLCGPRKSKCRRIASEHPPYHHHCRHLRSSSALCRRRRPSSHRDFSRSCWFKLSAYDRYFNVSFHEAGII